MSVSVSMSQTLILKDGAIFSLTSIVEGGLDVSGARIWETRSEISVLTNPSGGLCFEQYKFRKAEPGKETRPRRRRSQTQIR